MIEARFFFVLLERDKINYEHSFETPLADIKMSLMFNLIARKRVSVTRAYSVMLHFHCHHVATVQNRFITF